MFPSSRVGKAQLHEAILCKRFSKYTRRFSSALQQGAGTWEPQAPSRLRTKHIYSTWIFISSVAQTCLLAIMPIFRNILFHPFPGWLSGAFSINQGSAKYCNKHPQISASLWNTNTHFTLKPHSVCGGIWGWAWGRVARVLPSSTHFLSLVSSPLVAGTLWGKLCWVRPVGSTLHSAQVKVVRRHLCTGGRVEMGALADSPGEQGIRTWREHDSLSLLFCCPHFSIFIVLAVFDQ